MMSLHTHNDTLMCKVFPSSLGPTALRWFNGLRKGSINSFAELIQEFDVWFMTCNWWTCCCLWKWGPGKPSVVTLAGIGSCTTRSAGTMRKLQQVLFDWDYLRTLNCETHWQGGFSRIWGSWWGVSKSIKYWRMTGSRKKARLRS